MSRTLRKRPRISYYEPDEPNLDEYVFCADCADFVYEYCAIHGPLLVIPDDKVPSKSNFPAIVPRAALTIPHVFLHLARSVIPGAGIGVFSTLTLPRGVRFGPYRGQRTNEIDSMYCWQIYDGNKKPSHVIDAVDANRSNWMRYVNCSRHWGEQNLIAYQYQGQIYYRTIKIVPRFTELMVFYGSEFAHLLDVDLKKYNSPSSYAEKMGTIKTKKSTADQTKKKLNAALVETEEKGKNTTEDTVLQPRNNYNDLKLDKTKTINKDKKAVLDSNKIKTHVIQTAITKKVKFDENVLKENSKVLKENKLKTPQDNFQTQDITTDKNENKTETNFNKTSEIVHPKEIQNKLSCDICPFQAVSDKQLSNHLKAHAAYKSFDCDLCPYKTLNKKCIINHMNNHLGLECKKSFSDNGSFTKHCRIDSSIKPYLCNICDKSFSIKQHLNIHCRIHTGIKPYSCNICNKKFRHKSALNTHSRIHTGIKPYSCDICFKKFSDKSHFKTHSRIHTGIKPYSCDVCNKKFTQKSNLDTHSRIHTGIKPYSCDVCKKTFSGKGHLNTHSRIHTGIKPYSCDICFKKFSDKSHFNRHSRIHSGIKPYSCDVCNKKFTQKCDLNTHSRIHTGIKPYSCDICDKSFSIKQNLNIHSRIHTGIKPYSCDICLKTFSRKGYLKTHSGIHLNTNKDLA